jgi:hypothetical protein
MFRRSGNRFAVKNMRHSKILERVPIPKERGHALKRGARLGKPPLDVEEGARQCGAPPP